MPLAMAITDMATKLGVSRKTLSKILNENGAVTPDMAFQLARAFGTRPDLWLNLHSKLDLWKAEHTSDNWKRVRPLPKHILNPEI